jgi:hypothetical protein
MYQENLATLFQTQCLCRHFFATFQILDFPGNPLVELESDVFLHSKLLNLQEILMSRCRVSQVCIYIYDGDRSLLFIWVSMYYAWYTQVCPDDAQ